MSFRIVSWKVQTLAKNQSTELDVLKMPGFKVDMSLASDLNGKFKEIAFLIDTGFLDQPLGIPESLATELGIKPNSTTEIVTADGNRNTVPVGSCSLIFGQTTIKEIPVALQVPVPTIGFQLIEKMVFYTKSGQIVFIDFDGSVQTLATADEPAKV